MVVFWAGMAALLIENRAFDNTLGEMKLVGIGFAIALVVGLPSCVWIRSRPFGSGDRWAVCIFLALGLFANAVMGVTYLNHALAGPPTIESLQVLTLRWVPGSRKSSPRHWVTVRIAGQEKVIWVDADAFDALVVGQDYAVPVRHGWFGLPVIGCVHRCR